MKAETLREKTREELETMLEERREELFKLYSQRSLSQLEKPHRIREVRRDIARLRTILKDGGYSHK